MSSIAIYVALSKSLFAIAMVNGIFSLVCALFYVFMGAPDVALTESAIGAGLSTTLSLLTIFITKSNGNSYIHLNINRTNTKYTIIVICLLAIIFIILVIGLLYFPLFGNVNNPPVNETYFAYVTQSYNVYKVPNIVTIILGSFRGFDTLGETLVIFTAAIAVIALIRQGRVKK